MLTKKQLIRLTALLLVITSVYLTWRWFDGAEWLHDVRLLADRPIWLAFMFTVYLLSFLLKAAAWRIYIGTKAKFGIYFHAISYSLLVNHLLPVKAGDAVRTGLFMKHSGKSWDEALHSVAVMRLLDMLVLGAIGGIGIISLGLPGSWVWISLLAIGTLLLAIARYVPAIQKIPFLLKHAAYFHMKMLSSKGLLIVGLVTLSWVLEAGVIYAIAHIFTLQLSGLSLVWANSMTIAGQIFHITPGGIGTYESTMSGSLVLLGIEGKDAYRAAIVSHTFKFLFAYTLGAYSLLRMPLGWLEVKSWVKSVFPGKPVKEEHKLQGSEG
ncbi:lysylphosphatidylglycerol synthase transmembrane domain-containing protein [Paenibacillus sedimenti]|uniref:Phosphatidylglycerol lysyltransferase n=1 Tax=Paenibacillus sedimenti TaxID=2770274 RepID=A0A926QL73_9BACL|nr:lysylphosphatidylglycerol synthase transmembrane domain-containing protein [Paenibacillus sedimenti]MBD0382149.1 flippase-like domain-containing protein [Paenibacillus sedimenti]